MTNKKNTSGIRTVCLLALSVSMLFLNSCGKKPAVPAETTAQTAQTDAENAHSKDQKDAQADIGENAPGSAAGTGAVSTGTDGTASGESSAAQDTAANRPGEYTEKQAAAEQAIAAAEAAAPYHEDEFRKNAAKGMEARWTALDSKNPDSMSLEEFQTYAAESVQVEINAIGDFYLYSFEDKDFETAAGQYMNALASQLAGIWEISSQEELMQNEDYMRGYWLRIIAVHGMAENGEIPVSAKYQEDLKYLLDSYETAMKVLTPAQ